MVCKSYKDEIETFITVRATEKRNLDYFLSSIYLHNLEFSEQTWEFVEKIKLSADGIQWLFIDEKEKK